MPSGIKQAFASKLTDVDSVAREALGTLRFEGNKVFKYVEIKNVTATVAGAKGDPVGYAATGANGYLNSKVVLDLTDADNPALMAGVLQGTVTGTLGTSYFGWIQIRGPATLLTAVTNGAAGAAFTMVATDKTCIKAAESDAAAVYKQVAGWSYNATTGVVLGCPF